MDPTLYLASDPEALWVPEPGAVPPPPIDLGRVLPEGLRPAPRFEPVGGTEDLNIGEGFIWITLTATELGLPKSSMDQVIAWVRELPFEPAMKVLAVMAAELHHHPRDRERQLAFVGEMVSPEFLISIEQYLEEHENAAVFDPRHVATLQRLVVSEARESGPQEELTHRDVGLIVASVLVIADELPHGDPGGTAENPDWDAWARFTVQLGLWHENPELGDALARMWSQYVATPPELDNHHVACPVDDWLLDDTGFDIRQQIGIGFGLAVGAAILDGDLSPPERFARLPRIDHFKDTAMADREEIKGLISADREELQGLLGEPTPTQLAWDHSAFERKPFLRLADGSLLLHSPRALISWMTRGVHYRALDAGQCRPRESVSGNQGKRWLDYSGALGERVVYKLVEESHRYEGPIEGARVYGEIAREGPHGEELSPDVAVATEPDIVLLEVCSGRFSLQARTTGDDAKLREELQGKVASKVEEVLTRAGDVLAGRFEYERLGPVSRVYPAVVLAGDGILQTPMLWGWLRTVFPAIDPADPRIARPTILDLEDLEQLLVRVEAGDPLAAQLKRFGSSTMRELPPRNWLAAEGAAPGRPRYMERMLSEALANGGDVLYPGSSRAEEIRQKHAA